MFPRKSQLVGGGGTLARYIKNELRNLPVSPINSGHTNICTNICVAVQVRIWCIREYASVGGNTTSCWCIRD